MKVFKFCIGKDCTNACEAKSEADAWEWICKIKQLEMDQAKKLYTIHKIKSK